MESSNLAQEEEEEDIEEGGIIAIGIPDPKEEEEEQQETVNNRDENEKSSPPQPRNEQEATSLAVSKAVAENLAEHEHNIKHKRSLANSLASATYIVERTSLQSSPCSSLALSKSNDSSHSLQQPRQELFRKNNFDDDDEYDLDRKQTPRGTTNDNDNIESAATMLAWRRSSYHDEVHGNHEGGLRPIAAKAAAPAAVSSAASQTVTSSHAGTTTLSIRQKSGDSAEEEGGETIVQLARAIPCSHRFSVRGAAAIQQNIRTHRQDNKKQQEGKEEDTGPSLAPANSLLRNTDWTEIDTDLVSLASHAEPDSATTTTPDHSDKPGACAVDGTASQEHEDRVQAKLDREQSDAGPTMAPARHSSSGIVSEATSRMGPNAARSSHRATGQENDGMDVHELALMPPSASDDDHNLQETDWTARVSETPALALAPTQETLRGGGNDDDVDLEADAGIALRPGAFAIQGMDAANDSQSTFDFNDEGNYGEENRDHASLGPGFRDPSTDFLLDEEGGGMMGDDDFEEDLVLEGGALQAELYEREIVEGNIVEEDEEESDPTLIRRLRMVQALALCFSIVGIVCVVISAITGFGPDNIEPLVPIITGWNLVSGEQVFGPREEEDLLLFGSAVAMSTSGSRIVVTSPGADQGDSLNVGETYIFEEKPSLTDINGTTVATSEWELLHTLPGVGVNDLPTASLSISDNASLVAVGYPLYHQDGIVQVFDEATGWQSPIILRPQEGKAHNVTGGTTSMDRSMTDDSLTGFGYSVDLSPDGNLLAVGAPLFESQPSSVTGFVRVYQQVAPGIQGEPPSWVRLGTNDEELLQGVYPNELFGWSVALRNNRIAVGSPAFEVDRGLVRIFEWSPPSDLWRQVGRDLVGADQLARFGESVALSDDGTILAVGARGTAFDPGQVQVFRLNMDNEEWVSDKQVFSGDEAGDGLGASVALSKDGHILILGAPESEEFGTGGGLVQVWNFHEIDGRWKQEGSNIGGSLGANMGTSVAMSTPSTNSDDTDSRSATTKIRFVAGGPGADFDGSVTKAGSFFVFDRQSD